MPAPDFTAVLNARGLRLARVSTDDVSDRDQLRKAFREYVKPEDAKRFGIKEPTALVEGALVLVAVENNQQAVYLPAEVLTAHERRCLDEYLSALGGADGLPDVRNAEHELRNGGGIAANGAPAGLLRVSDLARRWHYTKEGVRKLSRRCPDFPPPCFPPIGGKLRLWALRDIEIFERERPELHSEEAKILKVRGFARARARGRNGKGP
jgi:hypothetical protein